MANNNKTFCIHGTQYRQIPDSPNYGVSSTGTVVNFVTGNILNPKDIDHFSGRYTIRNKNGKRYTTNAIKLIEKAYSPSWAKTVQNRMLQSV